MSIGKDIIEDIKRKHEEKMKALKDKQIVKKDENTGICNQKGTL